MGALTPERAATLGRIGGLVKSSRHEPRAATAAAREAFLRSFEDQVDPDRVLPPEERSRRALALRRAHMTSLALKRHDGRKEAANAIA
jgi:hypothetical protein